MAQAETGLAAMVLPDLVAPDLDIVFCGTAVGAASARQRAYYAGPGNAFWPTLYAVGLTPRQLRPDEYGNLLLYGMGLTDLAKHISGNDDILAGEDFDCPRLLALVQSYRPRILAFTGKRAARHFVGRAVGYGPMAEKLGDTMLFVLPSPSGSARRYWSAEPWRDLAALRGQR